jgi:hypothetical protein
MAPLIVTEIIQTSPESPSQWEGKTDDGRAIHIRYRHGCLDVGVGDTLDEAVDNSGGWPDDVPLYRARIGGPWDGVIGQGELQERLRDLLVYRL